MRQKRWYLTKNFDLSLRNESSENNGYYYVLFEYQTFRSFSKYGKTMQFENNNSLQNLQPLVLRKNYVLFLILLLSKLLIKVTQLRNLDGVRNLPSLNTKYGTGARNQFNLLKSILTKCCLLVCLLWLAIPFCKGQKKEGCEVRSRGWEGPRVGPHV